MEQRIDIFCCSASEDQTHLIALQRHLQVLVSQELINLWDRTNIQAGADWDVEIDKHLNSAEIILLLISPHFMASDYLNKKMRRAMERYEQQEARVIPIIVSAVNFQKTPLGKLQALPPDAVPVVSNKWHRHDEAWHAVAEGIRDVVQEHLSNKQTESRKKNFFAAAPLALREEVRDYTRYIDERTRNFVGRTFVFDAITHFTEKYLCGYYFIRGDPGIGKTALLAQLVKTGGYVHHFNIRSEGVNTTEKFLRNICAQLILTYQLNYSSLPAKATQDADFLKQILGEISGKLGPHEKAIIMIDALDEVDRVGLGSGVNILYLPSTLPQGIYFIVTMRRLSAEKLNLRVDDRKQDDTFDIEHNSVRNTGDIHEYVEQAVMWSGIQGYIATQKIDNEFFVEHLVDKSEGNFMYLHYVLPEIACGAYTDLDLEALPAGLQNYYEDHWRRMRGKDEDKWVKYKLPVIMALTVVKKPVSIDLIADFSKVRERARIRTVLQDWAQFLHEEQVAYEGGLQKRYHVYHESFHEFIAKKEEIGDIDINIEKVHGDIADTLLSEFFGNE